jgi:flagellar L-ring protein precursor FlgH
MIPTRAVASVRRFVCPVGAGLGVALLLSACAAMRPPQLPPESAAPLTLPVAAHKGEAGGVFQAATPWTLVSDNHAFRPGDVLTVVLEETTQASKSADTSFGKKSTVNFKAPVLAGKSIKADVALDAQRDFTGTATSTQQNALQGAITVIVQDVMPNGLLRVRGEKSLYLNQGEELVRVVGYVRSADIDSDNRVSSQRIANARIAYAGSGSLNDANSPGWLTRFFASPWMPF